MTLADWLLERITEDESVVRPDKRDEVEPATELGFDYSDATVCVPRAMFLAECDAKRRIVAAWKASDWHYGCERDAAYTDGGLEDYEETFRRYDFVIRCLALPYADRPGYDETWRP